MPSNRLDSAKVDFTLLTNLALNNSTRKANHKTFTLFTMDFDSECRPPQVLLAGDIPCDIEEVISVLSSTSDSDLNPTMKGLYRKEFIYGSVVHMASPEPLVSEPSYSPHHPDNYVAVKTGTFVRSSVLARNEEWCFIESNERSPDGNSFRMTQSTTDARQIGTGKARLSRIDQLCDVTSAFLVEKVPNTRIQGKRCCALKGNQGETCHARERGEPCPQDRSPTSTWVPETGRSLGLRSEEPTLHLLHQEFAFSDEEETLLPVWARRPLLDPAENGDVQQQARVHLDLICTRCLECVDSCEYGETSSQKWRIVHGEPDDEDEETHGDGVASDSDQG
ncbi:hypothetical protein FI667_g13966, partial [Globisporangium splendens]